MSLLAHAQLLGEHCSAAVVPCPPETRASCLHQPPPHHQHTHFQRRKLRPCSLSAVQQHPAHPSHRRRKHLQSCRCSAAAAASVADTGKHTDSHTFLRKLCCSLLVGGLVAAWIAVSYGRASSFASLSAAVTTLPRDSKITALAAVVCQAASRDARAV